LLLFFSFFFFSNIFDDIETLRSEVVDVDVVVIACLFLCIVVARVLVLYLSYSF